MIRNLAAAVLLCLALVFAQTACPTLVSAQTACPADGGSKPAATPDGGFSITHIPDSIFRNMQGKSWHKGCPVQRSDLRYLRLRHVDETGTERQGEMICHKDIAGDVVEIFKALYAARYPIHSIRLTDDFDGDDERSMRANNTSCFNYRTTSSGAPSRHSLGMAVDVNPLWNPCIHTTGRMAGHVEPANALQYARRDKASLKHNPAPITPGSLCLQLFNRYGFRWGGTWKSLKDYQHFEKQPHTPRRRR